MTIQLEPLLISANQKEKNAKETKRNGSTPGKPPDIPACRTWLVSRVTSAGLEPVEYIMLHVKFRDHRTISSVGDF